MASVGDVPKLSEPKNPLAHATHVRQRILGFAATLAIITYVDRVCISQAAPFIQEELHFTAAQMGLAFSAFAWAYALFEIPGGWLGDWIGPRKVLIRVVLLWSFFTAATGYAWNLSSLVITRFFFGMGEAGCFPNLTKAFMIWLPSDQRTRAQAVMWLSARWGGAFTPLLVIWVMSWLSWRKSFVLFGSLGIVWALFFYRAFKKNRQSESGRASQNLQATSWIKEDAMRPLRVPGRKLLRSRSVWLLWAQYFCLTYGWFFYVTWLPTYLKDTRGLELNQNDLIFGLGKVLEQFFRAETTQRVLVAALAGIPLFFGGLGAIVCGQVTPHLIHATGSVTRARRTLALLGFMGASVLLPLSFYVKDPLLAMLAMGLASFCNDLTMPGSWSTCMDVGGNYAGTLSGSMNMMGSIGAATAPLVIGLLLDYSDKNWALPFWISGIIYFLGGLCWLGLDPVTPIERNETSDRV
jgi:MFS family permease